MLATGDAVWVFLMVVNIVSASSTQKVSMPGTDCSSSVMLIDAVHISSRNDVLRDSCTIKLKADLDYLMIKFENISLSCGQYIKLYYQSDSDGKADKELDCRTQRYEIKDFVYTPGRYLTIHFDKPSGKQTYNFSMIVTSFGNEFFCDSSDQLDCQYQDQNICIDDDLECDGVLNCPQGKDELLCSYLEMDEAVSSVAIGIVITIIVLSLLACVLCIVGIVCCCQRRQRNRGTVIRQPPQQVTVQQPIQNVQPPPPVYYQTGPQLPPPQAGAPPGCYQAVPLAPPAGEPIYPPASYNPAYAPVQSQSPPATYQSMASYPTQAEASAPPPPYAPEPSQNVNYSPLASEKVPL